MAEPLANEQAVREKTARLRKLRLARDAAAKKASPQSMPASRGRSSASRPSGATYGKAHRCSRSRSSLPAK
jgi:hypothetical protein